MTGAADRVVWIVALGVDPDALGVVADWGAPENWSDRAKALGG